MANPRIGTRVRVVNRDDNFDLCEGTVVVRAERAEVGRVGVELDDPPPDKPKRGDGPYWFMPDQLEIISEPERPTDTSSNIQKGQDK